MSGGAGTPPCGSRHPLLRHHDTTPAAAGRRACLKGAEAPLAVTVERQQAAARQAMAGGLF